MSLRVGCCQDVAGVMDQAIEAKERVEIQPETQTLATITYLSNLFLLYPKLGMTGTAKTEEVSSRRFINWK